ncbi:unnamed protein product [Cunninghamella blakesleeana]
MSSIAKIIKNKGLVDRMTFHPGSASGPSKHTLRNKKYRDNVMENIWNELNKELSLWMGNITNNKNVSKNVNKCHIIACALNDQYGKYCGPTWLEYFAAFEAELKGFGTKNQNNLVITISRRHGINAYFLCYLIYEYKTEKTM